MIAPANWRRAYLASPAAKHIRAYLDTVLHDLEGAQIMRAITLLTGWRWRDDLDLSEIPPRVLEVTARKVREAHGYLVEADPDVTSAKDALMDARALWGVG